MATLAPIDIHGWVWLVTHWLLYFSSYRAVTPHHHPPSQNPYSNPNPSSKKL